MDVYAKFIETATREARYAVISDSNLHPVVAQTLLEAEVLIAVLRRITKLQLESLDPESRDVALRSLPIELDEYDERPMHQQAYASVRRYLFDRYGRHLFSGLRKAAGGGRSHPS